MTVDRRRLVRRSSVEDNVGMQPSAQASAELPIGHSARPPFGRAVLGSLAVAAVFLGYTWIAKETRGLYVHTPWQNDPYDAIVSFAIFFVPLLAGLSLVRVPLCRRDGPLPLRRAIDLLRVSRVLVGAISVTLLSDWASVLLGAESRSWDGATGLLIALLAVLTALTIAVGLQLRQAGRCPLEHKNAPPSPDWLSDAIALGEREAERLGSRREAGLRIVRWFDRSVFTRVRRYPLLAAAAVSVLLGVAVAGVQALEEGFARATLLFFGVAACGTFAFLALLGAHLRLISNSEPWGRAVSALVLACASIPLALAFRSSLWWIFGASDRTAGLTQVTELVLVVAFATGALAFVGEPLLRARRT